MVYRSRLKSGQDMSYQEIKLCLMSLPFSPEIRFAKTWILSLTSGTPENIADFTLFMHGSPGRPGREIPPAYLAIMVSTCVERRRWVT